MSLEIHYNKTKLAVKHKMEPPALSLMAPRGRNPPKPFRRRRIIALHHKQALGSEIRLASQIHAQPTQAGLIPGGRDVSGVDLATLEVF